MEKYRKKPVVIDALQFTGGKDSANQVLDFCPNSTWHMHIDSISIGTLEGFMSANPGDWIIKGVKGEFYPCKPDIFEQTYEPVSP